MYVHTSRSMFTHHACKFTHHACMFTHQFTHRACMVTDQFTHHACMFTHHTCMFTHHACTSHIMHACSHVYTWHNCTQVCRTHSIWMKQNEAEWSRTKQNEAERRHTLLRSYCRDPRIGCEATVRHRENAGAEQLNNMIFIFLAKMKQQYENTASTN